jgi:hypothetical protein
VTVDGNGDSSGCLYTSSSGERSNDCTVDASAASDDSATGEHSAVARDQVTRITFERRFTPGEAPAKPDLQVGDTLLGGQVMSLAIDQHGSVKGCEIVAASGAMRPDYGCSDAQAEKFQASVGGTQGAEQKQGYMTILVYGHSEHMV